MLALIPPLDNIDDYRGFSVAIVDFLERMSVADGGEVDQGTYVAVGWILASALRLLISAPRLMARDVSTSSTCHNHIV